MNTVELRESEKREYRSLKAREMRAERADDGKQYLSGYAATYNTLSDDLGWGMRERIMPGAFGRAIQEAQDVRHLINHDPSLVLGRTKAGTTELSEDAKGLKFRTLMPATSYAQDLFASVERGDIDECSFAFMAVRTAWIEEPDPDDEKRTRCIRELHDLDLFDVSTVTYPAYPGTNTAAERALRADGMGAPAELRSRLTRAAASVDPCACDCAACLDGDCEDCTNEACEDPNCRCMARAKREKAKKTKRVDGEDRTSDCFLIVGDQEDTGSWKLPWKFSTEDKTKAHLQNDLTRFNQLKNVPGDAKQAAWVELVRLCREHNIDVSEGSNLRSFLTPEQIYEFEREAAESSARDRLRVIQASL